MPDLQFVSLHLIESYKYVGLYLSLALGLIGLPIPDETLMTFAGFKVYQGFLNFTLTVIVAICGSLTGMSISFFIGSKLGLPFLRRFGKYLHISPQRLEKAQQWYQRYKGKSLILGYYLPGLRHITAYFAGISRLTFSNFLSFAAIGATTWVLAFVLLGRLVGKNWRNIGHIVHNYLWLFVASAVIVGVIVYLANRKQRVST